MGNSLPLPCVCRHCHGEVNEDECTAAVAGVKKRRRKQEGPAADRGRNVVVRAARPRHVVPVVDDTPEDGDARDPDRRHRQQEAGPECRVERAGYGDDGGLRVKIVMKRKDIAELVARLEQRGAEESNAATSRMEDEFSIVELAGCYGDGGGGGGVTMSPCRDAWRPRLSIIPENY